MSTITDDSQVYIVRESANGFYEMFFSDGNVLGTAPSANNRIEVEYIASSGSDANGGLIFSTNATVGSDIAITPVTVSASAGGDTKESIESIKLNAPRSYTAQNRLVTANDYTAMISSNYGSYLKDVSAWGGNDNVPPQYGKVYVSLVFLDGTSQSVQTQVKNQIKDQLTSNLSIMSIDTEFVDPLETFFEIQTTFNVDPIKNLTTLEALESNVSSFISQYMSTNLGTFGAIFRRSNLLSEIDNLSTAILNSRIDVKVQQRVTPSLNVEKDYVLNYPCALSTPDKDTHVVTSTVFKNPTHGNVVIKNELGSSRLQMLDLNEVVKIQNIGSYDASKGEVKLNALNISQTGGDNLKISAVPANQSTISPLRNYVITLDEDISNTTGSIDTGSTKVLL